MSSILSSFPSSPPTFSSLFKEPPEAIPSTDDLEALQTELSNLRQQSFERAKKAGNDLKTIEESLRRMKEKEKGKAKAVEKVKRERAFTPAINGDEPKLSVSSSLSVSKAVLPAFSVTSNGASSSRSSLDPRPAISDDAKKKKKKRKREAEGSDIEHESQKIRKGSPALSQSVSHKPIKTSTSVAHAAYKGFSGPDFSLPSSHNLLPARPPVQPTPVPGPSIPSEVKDDFSKSKQPSQVLISTFYTSVEPWLRPIKEEDVGFLEYTADEVDPFIMPKLGRHYADVWEDEDVALYGSPLNSTSAARIPSSSTLTGRSKWDPSTLTEQDLVSEEKGHGPLTERLVSALLPVPNMSEWRGVKAAEDAMEGRPANGATAAAGKEKLSVSELEQRIKDTMRYHGLLDVNPDYSDAVDDPIATALRQAQSELQAVVATNNARKTRLVAIARDRLGYQEYLDLRDSIDKNISGVYTKLQKKDGPKGAKKRKKVVEANGTDPLPSTPTPCPAALGLGPDEENQLVVPEQLKQLVQTRGQWVDTVGGVFEAKQREEPGRIWRLPHKSVFEGIDEQVRVALDPGLKGTPEPGVSDSFASRTTSKGEDVMDIQ